MVKFRFLAKKGGEGTFEIFFWSFLVVRSVRNVVKFKLTCISIVLRPNIIIFVTEKKYLAIMKNRKNEKKNK